MQAKLFPLSILPAWAKLAEIENTSSWSGIRDKWRYSQVQGPTHTGLHNHSKTDNHHYTSGKVRKVRIYKWAYLFPQFRINRALNQRGNRVPKVHNAFRTSF
jgi:hypothetical protein